MGVHETVQKLNRKGSNAISHPIILIGFQKLLNFNSVSRQNNQENVQNEVINN